MTIEQQIRMESLSQSLVKMREGKRKKPPIDWPRTVAVSAQVATICACATYVSTVLGPVVAAWLR